MGMRRAISPVPQCDSFPEEGPQSTRRQQRLGTFDHLFIPKETMYIFLKHHGLWRITIHFYAFIFALILFGSHQTYEVCT